MCDAQGAEEGLEVTTGGEMALTALIDPDHEIKRETAQWARVALAFDDLVDRDRASGFWVDGWRRCAEKGIQGLRVPTAHGGQGSDIATTLLTLEGLGYGCRDNGLVFALCVQIWTIQTAIARFGTEEQQRSFLPAMARGERFGGFCMTELESGSDAFSLSTRAERRGDAYVVTGRKAYVTLAPVADVFLVFASTRPDAGRWGLSAFLVEADRPGVTVLEGREKMGMRTTPFGDVVFDGCEVPVENRLGPEGAGASLFTSVLEDERAFMFVGQLGAMERVVDEAARYATERRQFGQPIGGFQAVSHRVADMKLRHETARLLLYRTALLAQQGRPISMAAALTKLHVSEAAAACALDAVLVHGAKGYLTELGVERDLRDAVGGLVYSGTNDLQRNTVARLMGLGG